MPSNITYILGAGASYNALPIIDSMDERMDYFLRSLNLHLKTKLESLNALDIDLQSIIKSFQPLFKEARKHRTIDTFAKKLFLRENYDDLYTLKLMLSCYLEFEQDNVIANRGDNSLIDGCFKQVSINPKSSLKKIGRVSKLISPHLDYRYDVFFATLLEKQNGHLKLPNNINIISWNYDSQLELAYQGYSDQPLHHVRELINIYPRWGNPPINDNGISSIFKLNGNSGQYYQDEIVNTYYDDNENQNSYLASLRFTSERLRSSDFSDMPNICFAWENQPLQMIAQQRANEILKQTHILIIIGYSFPNFNRQIDNQLMDGCKFDEVWYQVPEEHYDSLVKRIEFIKRKKTYSYTDKDQFFIPLSSMDYSISRGPSITKL